MGAPLIPGGQGGSHALRAAMRIATGKVVSGKIVVDGDAFSEGTTVTILAPDDEEVFDLSADAEAALLAAIDEAERGATIDAAEFLGNLDRK